MASVLPNQSKRCCNEEKYIRANHRSISLIFRAVMQNIPKSELLTLHSETGWIFAQLKKKNNNKQLTSQNSNMFSVSIPKSFTLTCESGREKVTNCCE